LTTLQRYLVRQLAATTAATVVVLLLVGLGFIESLTIYVLVVALSLIFANPATSHFLK
jgi:F0F1-type ATP synthase membrane subunit c/vacuolar-type H+-ATPase subunit K